MNPRRHRNDSKNFDELTFAEQVKAMNMAALQFRKKLDAHLRRAEQEGRDRENVLRDRLRLLEKILADFPKPEISIESVRILPSPR